MTALVHYYLNKRFFFNLFPAMVYKKMELPLIAPFIGLLSAETSTPLSCSCCSWKGSELKARKHYLEAGSIAELEFFCPKCNHYLGFISEPLAD